MKAWIPLSVCVAIGCAHVEPAPLSAEEHRAVAAREERAAREDSSRYDPRAVELRHRRPEPGNWNLTPDTFEAYNPTEPYRVSAERHLRRAREHTEAAAALERFEAEACGSIPKEVRAACPLVTGAVQTVEETRQGIRLHLKADADGPALAQRMRCHLAFAQTRGFDWEPSCPLYFIGVSVTLEDNGHAIELRGRDATTARQIRAEAREIFAPPPAVPRAQR